MVSCFSGFFSDSAQETTHHSVVVEFLAQKVLNISAGICMSPPSKPSTLGSLCVAFRMIQPFTAAEREGCFSSCSVSSTASYPHVLAIYAATRLLQLAELTESELIGWGVWIRHHWGKRKETLFRGS